jgi:2-polyprenyl-3-methyl-5-hydroxy-6-metoxy-1,4-benzoquinol methylase/ribosomal protein L32
MTSIRLVSQPGHERVFSSAECNICGSRKISHRITFDTFEGRGSRYENVAVIRCGNCGIRRRSPELHDDYEEEYHTPYMDQGSAIHSHILRHFADLMTIRFRDFRPEQERLLDVGCSTGRVLQLARTMGFDAEGLDYSAWAVDHCRSLGFRTTVGSLLGQWVEGERFDVVHCSHTIEHVPDPVAYLMEMHRLLRPGGHLMLSFPNFDSFPRLCWQKKWPIWCLDSHLWQFSLSQMKNICRQLGYTIILTNSLHGYQLHNHWLQMLFDLSEQLKFGDGAQIIAKKDL